MRNFLDAVWWWTRLVGLLIVATYLISLIAMNAGQKADLWYWFGRPEAPSSIISLVLVSFLSGGVVFTTGWAMLKALIRYRRTREARRERVERERRLDIERKAAMLRTKPAPQPIVRKPPPPPPPKPTVAAPEPIDPRDAETRSVTLIAVPTTPRVAEPPIEVETIEVPPTVPLAGEAETKEEGGRRKDEQ